MEGLISLKPTPSSLKKCQMLDVKKEVTCVKLDGVALLVADPSPANSTNLPIHSVCYTPHKL